VIFEDVELFPTMTGTAWSERTTGFHLTEFKSGPAGRLNRAPVVKVTSVDRDWTIVIPGRTTGKNLNDRAIL
jgi:hypothetical protein